MPVSLDVLNHHLTYSAWAGNRLLAAAAPLSSEELTRDFGTADRSVLGTLEHIFADRLWLDRIENGGGTMLPAGAVPGIEYLEDAAPEQQRRWAEWFARLTPESPLTEIAYRDLKGNHWKQPLWQILLHVVNHATHHRGQVAGFLRALGRQPPTIDLIAYYRQRMPVSPGV